MKLRNTLISSLAALAMAAVGAHAQEIDTYAAANGAPAGFGQGYNDDDLVLAFYNASDSTVNGDVLFNLGTVSSFTGLAAGTYSVAGFNGSTTSGQPSVGFGSSELSANSMTAGTSSYWTVYGSDTTSNELWLTGTTAQHQASSTTQGVTANIISAIGSAGANNVNTDSSAYDGSSTTYNYIGSNNKWQNFSAVTAASVSSSSDTLALYALEPGTGANGSSTELGYFTLTDSSGTYSLSFTSLSAIPEPSTYAAILGALTIGFVLVRRRFASASFSALA